MVQLKSRPALIISDMQNCFCHESGGFSKIGIPVDRMANVAPRINQLRSICHARNIPVIFTAYAFNADYSDSGLMFVEPPASALKDVSALIRDSWDAEIMDELKPAESDIVVRKTRNSPFLDTELEQLLRDRGIDQVIVTGVGTNICVESTARDAYNRGFHTTTVSDATDTLSDEDHNASIKNLAWFGGTATLAEVEAALKGFTAA